MIFGKVRETVLLGSVLWLGLGAAGDSRADDWAQVGVAARAEANVVVSIPPSAALRKALEPAFEKKFPGIDLELLPSSAMNVVVRTGLSDPLALAPAVRREVAAIDPTQPVHSITTRAGFSR